MTEGILQVRHLETELVSYYYVQVSCWGSQLWIDSTQAIKPLHLRIDLPTVNCTVGDTSVVLQDQSVQYLFQDDTDGLVRTLRDFVGTESATNPV